MTTTDKNNKFSDRLKFALENYTITFIATMTMIFLCLYFYIDKPRFLLILNSLYLGCIVSTIFIYGYYFFYTVLSFQPYNREKQFTLSVGLQHLSYILIVTYSATYRKPIPDPEIPVDWQLLLSRYLVIIATTLQVFSPDMGQSLFYGVNRKVLLLGMSLGALLAVAVLFYQMSPAIAATLGF